MADNSNIFVLKQPAWVPDKDVHECKQCTAPFSTFNRKHHCRHCGQIFCAKCCNHRLALPQLGLDKKERVCDNCSELAEIVAQMVSDKVQEQCQGARRLAEYGTKEDGLEKLVHLGGLDTLLHLCKSQSEEVLADATGTVEAISRFERVQNTLISRGLLNILNTLISSTTIQNLVITNNAVKTLFHLSKSVDTCEAMGSEKELHLLLVTAVKEQAGADEQQLHAVQGLAARTLSYLCMNDKNQLKVIEDRRGALESLVGLLKSRNDDVRKYTAKSLAYLSLRNDKSKSQLLRSNSLRTMLQVIQSDNVRETLSHMACTIANLATNGDIQEILIKTPDLLEAFCRMAEGANDRSDILRHVARGLANFALYESNKDRLVSIALPLLIKLGQTPVPETLRHIVRAIDNLLSNASDAMAVIMRDAGATQVLQTFIETQTAPDNSDIVKRASMALQQLQALADQASTAGGTQSPGSGHRSPIADKANRASASPHNSANFTQAQEPSPLRATIPRSDSGTRLDVTNARADEPETHQLQTDTLALALSESSLVNTTTEAFENEQSSISPVDDTPPQYAEPDSIATTGADDSLL